MHPLYCQPMQKQVRQLVQQMVQWASGHQFILAAALVGSQARGTADAKSDIDLMFLTEQSLLFRTSTDWLREINWGDRRIESWQDKEYGAVWSRHLYLYADDTERVEIELSFGQPDWAAITPLDPGTQRVVRDGCRVLYDPEERLTKLVQFVLDQG